MFVGWNCNVTVPQDKEKQQILTSEKLERGNIWPFSLKNNLNDQSIFRIVSLCPNTVNWDVTPCFPGHHAPSHHSPWPLHSFSLYGGQIWEASFCASRISSLFLLTSGLFLLLYLRYPVFFKGSVERNVYSFSLWLYRITAKTAILRVGNAEIYHECFVYGFLDVVDNTLPFPFALFCAVNADVPAAMLTLTISSSS